MKPFMKLIAFISVFVLVFSGPLSMIRAYAEGDDGTPPPVTENSPGDPDPSPGPTGTEPPSPTPSDTEPVSPEPTASISPESTESISPEPTASPSPTPAATDTPTPAPSAEETPQPTPEPTVTPALQDAGPGDFIYSVSGTTATITGYTGSGGDIAIPDTIDGYTVTAIASYAFNERAGLTSVAIPDSVTAVSRYAFYLCPDLNSVSIGSGLANIDIVPIHNCPAMQGVTVDAANAHFCSVDGVLFDKSQSTLFYCPMGKTGSYSIPGGVTHIAYGAFQWCRGLTSITLPDGLTDIGDYGFYYCTALTSIHFPDTLRSIGFDAFESCNALTEVVIPDSVTFLDKYAFSYNPGLTSVTIGNGVTNIDNYTFYHCFGLASVRIPNSVTSISSNAFEGDAALTIHGYAGSYAQQFAQANGIPFIVTGSQRPGQVTGITCQAYPGCIYLSWTEVPGAEYYTVSTPDNEEIQVNSNHAWLRTWVDDSTTYVTAHNSFGAGPKSDVVHFANPPFPDTPSAVQSGSITILNNGAEGFQIQFAPVTDAEGYELRYSTSPDMTDSGNIGFGIGYGVQEYATTRFQPYMLSPDATYYFRLYSVNGMERYGEPAVFSAVIQPAIAPPSTLLEIGNLNAGSNSISMTILPTMDNPQSGWNNASGLRLYWATSADLLGDGYTYVDMPVSCQGQNEYVLQGLQPSTTYYLRVAPANSQGRGALSEIRTVTTASAPTGGFLYTAEGSEATITGYTGPGGDVVIPSQIDGLTVTGVGSRAFYDNQSITRLTIPGSVETIGSEAFMLCSGMESLTIGNGVRTIESSAFEGCSHFTDLVLPDSVTTIGTSAFKACGNLRRATLPANLTVIGDSVFYKCGYLESITIPDTVVAIGDYAFDWTGLTSITIPTNVTSIGNSAFAESPALASVIFKGNLPAVMGTGMFGGAAAGFTVYYHVANASSWAEYAAYPKQAYFMLTLNLQDGSAPQARVAVIDGDGRIAEPETPVRQGYSFLGWYKDADGYDRWDFGSDTASGDVTLYAKWAIHTGDGFYYTVNEEGVSCTIRGYNGPSDMVIPQYINGLRVTSIDSRAFGGNESITSVTFPMLTPEQLASPEFMYGIGVGWSVFENCSNLTSVDLANNAQLFGAHWFAGDTKLMQIIAAADSPRYTCAGGVLFNKDMTTLIAYPPGKAGTQYSVPEGVTELAYKAFMTCGNLQGVSLPESLTGVGSEVFERCESLASVYFKGDLPSSMSQDAFSGAPGGMRLYYHITREASWAGYNGYPRQAYCMLTLDLQDGSAPQILPAPLMDGHIEKLEEAQRSGYFFGGWYIDAACTQPYWPGYEVTNDFTLYARWMQVLHTADGFTYMIDQDEYGDRCIIIGYDGGPEVRIPAYIGGIRVGWVYPESLNNNNTIISVTFPTFSAEELARPECGIGLTWATFSGSSNLVTVDLANSGNIGSGFGEVFYRCGSLTQILAAADNPDHRSVDGVLFSRDMTSLFAYPPGKQGATYSIPAGVTKLENSAFVTCGNLTGITIPASVSDIGDAVFEDCWNLTDVNVDGANACFRAEGGVLYNKQTTELIVCTAGKQGNFVFPDTVTAIRCRAFSAALGVTAMHISAGLTALNMPDFNGGECFVFDGLRNLAEYTVDAGNPSYSAQDGVLYNKNGTELLRCPSAKTGSLVLPDCVVKIGDSAFDGCSLASVTIPNSVTDIAGNAFDRTNGTAICGHRGSFAEEYANAHGIRFIDVDMYYNGFLYGIKDNEAFITGYTGAGGEIAIPSEIDGYRVAGVADYGFQGCESITGVSFPGGINYIGPYAFSGCTGLASIKIPYGVGSVNEGVFSGCTALATVVLPNSVGDINELAFENCTGLMSVTIPGSVTKIGDSAFKGAGSFTIYGYRRTYAQDFASEHSIPFVDLGDYAYELKGSEATITGYYGDGGDIVIPSELGGYTVTGITNGAFAKCGMITSVFIPACVVSIGDNGVFIDCNSLTQITVDAANPAYVSQDGILYSAGLRELVCYPAGKAGVSYTTPESVTYLYAGAFSGSCALTSITLTRNVERVTTGTFSSGGLEEIIVAPDNPYLSNYNGDGVLYNAGRTEIWCYPQAKHAAVYDIPDTVKILRGWALAGKELASVNIPASVGQIEPGALAWDLSLMDINVDPANPAYASRDGVLCSKDLKDLIQFPGGRTGSYSIPDGVGYIESFAFSGMKLTEVKFPASVVMIGDSAFAWNGDFNFKSAVFLGDVFNPNDKYETSNAFDGAPNGFTMYYHVTKAGTWSNYKYPSKPFVMLTLDPQDGSAPQARLAELHDGRIDEPEGAQRDGYFFGGWYLDAACTQLCFYDREVTDDFTLYARWMQVLHTADGFTYMIDQDEFGDRCVIIGYDGPPDVHIPAYIEGIRVGWVYPCSLSGNDTITSVTFPTLSAEDLAKPECGIGMTYAAFSGSSNLVTVDLANSGNVGSGFGNVFYGCGRLTQILAAADNPDHRSVDGVLFSRDMTALFAYPPGKPGASYTIPDGVTKLENTAFSSCCNLTGITIPSSVSFICEAVFADCGNLTQLNVDAANAYFCAEDGVLYDKQKTSLFACTAGKQGTFVIPDTVTMVKGRAFSAASGVTALHIPAGLTELNVPDFTGGMEFALDGCRNLAEYTVDAGNPYYSARDGVLYDKEAAALLRCPPAKTGALVLPDSVVKICDSAFDWCSLTSVTIPNGVTDIAGNAFDRTNGTVICGHKGSYAEKFAQEHGIPFVNLDQNYNGFLYDIKDQVLTITGYTGAGGEITIPAEIDGRRVEGIADYAFRNCASITGVSFPDSISYIGSYAFMGCTGLTGVRIPYGIQDLSEGVFSGCTALAAVVLPGSLQSIGDYAFRNCTSLASVTIPGNVKKIADTAFENAAGFTIYGYRNTYAQQYALAHGIPFVDLGDYAYDLNGNEAVITGYYGDGGDIAIPTELDGHPVTGIAKGAFAKCVTVTSVFIPACIVSIGDTAFSACDNLTQLTVDATNPVYSSLDGSLYAENQTEMLCYPAGKPGASFIVPESVQYIRSQTFAGRGSLRSLTITRNVAKVEGDSLGPDGLTEVIVDPANAAFCNYNSDGVMYNRDVTAVIYYPGGRTAEIYDIPGTVTSIEAWTLAGKLFRTVNIPAGVQSIAAAAFAWDLNLTDIHIDPANPVLASRDGVLYSDKGCTDLLQFPGGRMGNYTIPDGVGSIHSFAFTGMKLTSVTVPASVVKMGDLAFAWNSNFNFQSAIFLGDVFNANEKYETSDAFDGEADGFTMYYHVTKTGTWSHYNYPSRPFVMLTLDPQDGSAPQARFTALTDGRIAQPEEPAREGYAFGGWYREAACVNAWNFSMDTAADDTTLYALWTETGDFIYTVSGTSATITGYRGSGGIVAIPEQLGGHAVVGIGDRAFENCASITAVTIPNTVVSIGNAAFSGCTALASATFAGTLPGTMGTGIFNGCASGFRIYYHIRYSAAWAGFSAYTKQAYCMLTLDLQDGSAPQAAFRALTNGRMAAPATPVRMGYTFGGWYMEPECLTAWVFGTNQAVDDVTLYAKWTIKTYTVHFNAMGGSAVDDVTADYNTIILPPTEPARVGYAFGGWFKESACTNAWSFETDVVTANITLYAKWTINTYTVTFDSQGGNAVAPKTANYNALISAPATPTMTGYTFGGWYLEPECATAWVFNTNRVAEDITLYAKWTIKTYMVHFNAVGGSAVDDAVVEYNTALPEPLAPYKTGYTFVGWYKESACTNAWDFGADLVTANTTLYAKWTINTFTVTFDSQGGSAVASKTANYNALISAPAAPTLTGYTFGGWYLEPECTAAWVFNTNRVTEDTTLYAKWTIKTFTVHFNAMGGSAVDDAVVEYDLAVPEPAAPNKTGYTFTGWYKESACTNAWDFETDFVTANVTLYAKWVINTYTVAFDSQGGSAVASKTANYNALISAPTAPAKTGYTFGGWYLEPECATSWVFSTNRVTGDVTLYAKWTIKTYTVHFNAMGGSAVNDATVEYSRAVTEPTPPSKAGYVFAGWYRESACTNAWDFEADVVTANVTLYAKWVITTYTVSFDSQGGSAVASKTANYNALISAPTAPTKAGYTFSGWYLEPAYTTAWVFGTNRVTSNITLYAKWTIKAYTVHYNSMGGSAVGDASTAYNTGLTEPVAPAKTGFAFAGWYKESTCANAWNFQTDVLTANITLYAKWTINIYTVSFDSQGGSAVAGKTANYNATVSAPAAPTMTGYTFGGWYQESECATAWVFGTNRVTSDITLYAKWTIKSYTVRFNARGGSTVADVAANYNSTIAQPADPTRAGYVFAGWYKDLACTTPWNFATDVVTAATTLYANWTR